MLQVLPLAMRPVYITGINDGAAALVLMSSEEAQARHAPVLAKIVSWAQAGVDPAVMGTGPIPATRKAVSASDV